MIIRKAEEDQYQAVMDLYYEIIDGMYGRNDSAGWKKDIYPEPDFVAESIQKGDLYIGLEDDEVIASMVLNHEYNEAYKEYDWPTKADDSEITVIHILGVHPSQMGRGVAKQLVRFAIEHARENGQKAIRLDVLKGNLRAEKLYPDVGFRYLDTLPMFYEDTGWMDFELYEYPLTEDEHK